MNINSFINQISNKINTPLAVNANSVSSQEMLENGINKIMGLNNNAVISGKIINISQNELLLEIGDNEILKASVDGNINPKVGDTMSFGIKSAASGKIMLTALFENSAQESTVSNALKGAGLPPTAENQYMVKTMIGEGLPIDKNSLYSMTKAMQINANADVLDLAQMKRLSLPLEPQMVTQFNNYKNFEHTLTSAFDDIVEALVNDASKLLDEGNVKDAADILKQYSNLLVDENADDVESSSTQQIEDKNIISDDKNELSLGNYKGNEVETVNEKMANNSENGKVANSLVDLSVNEPAEGKDINNFKPVIKEKISLEDAFALANMQNDKEVKGAVKPDTNILIDVWDKLKEKDADDPIKQKELISDISDKLKRLNPDEDSNGFKEAIKEFKTLINSKDFKNNLEKATVKGLLLKPEEVAEDGKVSKVYERIANQVKNLNASLNMNGVPKENFANAVNNLNSNLNFMNELNQAFSYVQIPLKMMNKDASGELYVYTNKKSLSREDGNVSALLHLDMDYLGPVNVHVLLNENNHVNTKFSLADESALNLIADNIDMLNDRLNKRGYNMTSEFINDSEDKKVMDEILETNKNISIISSTSFDAKA